MCEALGSSPQQQEGKEGNRDGERKKGSDRREVVECEEREEGAEQEKEKNLSFFSPFSWDWDAMC